MYQFVQSIRPTAHYMADNSRYTVNSYILYTNIMYNTTCIIIYYKALLACTFLRSLRPKKPLTSEEQTAWYILGRLIKLCTMDSLNFFFINFTSLVFAFVYILKYSRQIYFIKFFVVKKKNRSEIFLYVNIICKYM